MHRYNIVRPWASVASVASVLTAIDVLTVIAFILSMLALFSGTSTTSLRKSAILTFDTSSVNRALSSTSATHIPDWYEVHYLSICSGMWNSHDVSAGKNESTTTCLSQTAGYTFSLVQFLQRDTGIPTLAVPDSSFGTLSTRAPLILLAVGIAFTGLALLLVLHGAVTMAVAPTAKPPLNVLRTAYFAILISAHMLTISGAEITSWTGKAKGTATVGEGWTVQAWTEKGFYVFMWLATGLIWTAYALALVVGCMLARVLRTYQSNRPQEQVIR